MLFSAWSKLMDPRGFRDVLREYPLIPRTSIRTLSRLVPAFEIATGGVLLSQSAWLTRLGVFLAFGFIGLVTVSIASRVWRGERKFRCGCSGDLSRPHSAHLLLTRNTILLGILATAYLDIGSYAAGLPAVLSGFGLFAMTQLTIAVWSALEAIREWKASG